MLIVRPGHDVSMGMMAMVIITLIIIVMMMTPDIIGFNADLTGQARNTFRQSTPNGVHKYNVFM